MPQNIKPLIWSYSRLGETRSQSEKGKGKGKGPVFDIALLYDEHVLRSALQSRKWQLIGMS